MAEYEITTYFSNEGTRNEVRMRIVDKLSQEKPGKGRGRQMASRYTYYVETLSDGNRIYLRRPANLHNGFDFLVCIENIYFNKNGERRRNFPKHTDLIADLEYKKSNYYEKYKKLYELMMKVYNCENINEETMNELIFPTGFSTEMILKTLKWLFIEQDIRYWNYSGRDMLWQEIQEI